MLQAALDLLRQSLGDPALLHHLLGPALVLIPLLAALGLLILALLRAEHGHRLTLSLLPALLLVLFSYDFLLARAITPPDPQSQPQEYARAQANPAQRQYQRQLAQHRQETRRLILPTLALVALAILALCLGKPGKILLPLLLLACLTYAALSLLLLQRKLRLDHPELPPGSPRLDQFWQPAPAAGSTPKPNATSPAPAPTP